MIIWLIGLFGVGKTTVGQHLAKQWRAKAPNTVFIDGETYFVIHPVLKHLVMLSREAAR